MITRYLAILAALVIGSAVNAQSVCATDRVLISGDFGEAGFSVALADTPELRARGLMFVERMPRFSGMLFIYEQPQRAVFWMRNTLIPLDMIFADAQGVIRTVHSNAIPHDETGIDGGPDVLYVLEINGGMAEMLGISVGDVMRHPVMGPDAALPC